jgi:hypothetical protein
MAAQAPLLLLLLATTLACVSADATNPLGGAAKTVGGVQSRKDVNDGYRGGKVRSSNCHASPSTVICGAQAILGSD